MSKRWVVLIVVGVLLLVASTPAYAKPATWSTLGWHVVKPGETLYCIGRAYGVSPSAIASYNGIVNPNRLCVGQALAIPNAFAAIAAGPKCVAQFGTTPPPPPPPCTCAKYHTVAAGQNLYRISLIYGVNMYRIAQCNGIFNLNYVRVGQVLCIPGV